jgi:GH18 family chitinase
VPAAKLNLGMPLYGRSFTSTAGLGQPYSGIGTGSWEAGVYDFKDMPLAGAKEFYDTEAGGTYSYNNDTGMLVSYDTVDMALKKVDYIVENRLGGAMWWEVSGDKTDGGSIITNVSLCDVFAVMGGMAGLIIQCHRLSKNSAVMAEKASSHRRTGCCTRIRSTTISRTLLVGSTRSSGEKLR